MKKKIRWKPYIIASIISIIIGVGIFLIFYLTNKTNYGLFNGASVAGIVVLSIGGLSFVAKQGFFDFASYGFKQLGAMIFSKTPNAYKDYPEYRDYKNGLREKQSNYFIAILIVGTLFLIAYFILKLTLK